MTMSLEELRRLLGNDEPDYVGIAVMVDDSAADHLRTLSRDSNVMLAQKAVYLASLVEGGRAQGVVEEAARSEQPLLRIASASSLVNLPAEVRNRIAERLLDSPDVSIQKLTVRALEGPLPPGLTQKLSQISSTSGSDVVRTLSKQKLIDLP